MANFINNAIRAKGSAEINCNLVLNFSDGSQKIKEIRENDIVKDLTYKVDGTTQTIDGRVLVINFSSQASESEGIVSNNLALSKSVFSSMVKPISLIVDTSEVYKSDVVNVPINDIVNIKADKIVNEKYQGTVYTVDATTSFADAIAQASDGDTVLIAGGSYDGDIDISKAVRITAKKDADNNYESAFIKGNVKITAAEGTVEIDHVTFKDLTSKEGTGPKKSTAKGNGIEVTGNADINIHDVVFDGFNNFYNMIGFLGEGAVTVEDCEFIDGANYHVIEFGTQTVVSKAVIKDNKFGNICTHNVISFYNYGENATIEISNNEFAYSGNALRLSNVNNGTVVVDIVGNKYLSTDDTDSSADANCSSDTYGGFAILQDYTGTQDFSLITMNFSQNFYAPDGADAVLISEKTDNTVAQGYYVYKDKADYQFTYPVVNYNN